MTGEVIGIWGTGMQRARASAALILTLVILGYSSLSTRYPGSEAKPSLHLFPGNCLSNEFMGDLSDPQINQMDKHLIIGAGIKSFILSGAI